jgi:hypothetical protein
MRRSKKATSVETSTPKLLCATSQPNAQLDGQPKEVRPVSITPAQGRRPPPIEWGSWPSELEILRPDPPPVRDVDAAWQDPWPRGRPIALDPPALRCPVCRHDFADHLSGLCEVENTGSSMRDGVYCGCDAKAPEPLATYLEERRLRRERAVIGWRTRKARRGGVGA